MFLKQEAKIWKNIMVSQMPINLTLVMGGDICNDQKSVVAIVVAVVIVVCRAGTLLLSCTSVKFRIVTLNQLCFVKSQLSLTFVKCPVTFLQHKMHFQIVFCI